jgi:radical SAM protein with 4Fe4S-binding SPASM domain
VVWEITWRCDLRCPHCLVSGGPPGQHELSPREALGVVSQLAELGTRVVTLTGGEPLLRGDWARLSSAVVEAGMTARLSTNGHRVDDGVVARLVDLGVEAVIVSLDGLQATHDRLRAPGRASSFDRVVACLDRVAATPIRPSVITTVSRGNLAELPALHDLLKRHRVRTWQVQLAWRQGRASSGFDVLRPDELPRLADFLRGAAADEVLPPRVHNSIGWMSADEPRLRASGRRRGPRFWPGCRCGLTSLGIEPDGGVKGCASQVGAPFVVGNVRDEPLRTLWEDRERWHWLSPDPSRLTGQCGDCALGTLCGAGCTAMALASSGELFDNRCCLRQQQAASVEGSA